MGHAILAQMGQFYVALYRRGLIVPTARDGTRRDARGAGLGRAP